MTDFYLKQTSAEEQQLYDHLLYCVQIETPEELLERFQRLLINGRNYEPHEIWLALEALVCDKEAPQNFTSILNRCCHILINRWQINPRTRWAIPRLVELFDYIPPPGSTYARTPRRLRSLVRDFRSTEQFLTLKRLARVVGEDHKRYNGQAADGNGGGVKLVGMLIDRYPYLYEHCLLSQDSNYEHQQTVRQIRDRIQRKFELDLSHFVTYKVRVAQPENANRKIPEVKNPTLLTDSELSSALKGFIGTTRGGTTHSDVASRFRTSSIQLPSYRLFKDNLYEYLTDSVDPKFGEQQFYDRLYKRLQSMLTRYDSERPDERLILRTSNNLLNFLIVESLQRPDHYIFVDLVTNLGPTDTVILLLKITLLCKQVKPYLEKRFSILFSHYEGSPERGVPWLVKSMENLHVALSTHFGEVDLSYLRQLH
ncbi:MAG: hypothetical protein HC910_10460 [Spirulinaceae cyanobacterium SM2_1_0]|nr:hypothetical protein [Spirulinaceae cyanobacterium SM2_1_0]